MPVALDGDGLALPGAAEAEHPALGVRLHDVVEVRVGDVLRAQRVAGKEDRFGVVAGLGADVDGHGAHPIASPDRGRTVRQPDARPDPRLLCARSRSSASSSRTSRAAGSAASPRSRRGRRLDSRSATSARTSCRPARAAASFADATARGQARMIIGEERRGRRALGRGAAPDAASPRRPAGPAGLRARGAAGARGDGPARRDARRSRAARAGVRAAHREEIGIDPLRRDPEGFRWRTRAQIEEGRSWIWLEDGVIALQGGGVGVDAVGRAAPAGVGRPGLRDRGYAKRRCATSAGCCSSRCPPCASSSRPRTPRRSRLRGDRDAPTISYRSILF